MPAPTTTAELLDLADKSGVVDKARLDAWVRRRRGSGKLPESPKKAAVALVADGVLTRFQAQQFLLGKYRGLVINDKYKLLEHLGTGGMGSVYLGEHVSMRRRVAIKVLPANKAKDPSAIERFYREARAVAALDHPNIVRAHDIDRQDKLHFLVMEYVDGHSLQTIVGRHGPMDVLRAAHYIRQAAHGLQHAHEAGLVHRDIKPGNLLLDRFGTVKVLDMGLARFFHDETDNLSKKYDETVIGTADYLAPEQTLGTDVDIRADIYSLGITFYFLLAGQTPFGEGTAAQKLIWHQVRQPKPIRAVRPDVPEGIEAIINKMIAKDPAERFQTPGEVVDALAPWTEEPIPPPPAEEMPDLSPALGLNGDGSGPVSRPLSPGRPLPGSPSPRRFGKPTFNPRPGNGTAAVASLSRAGAAENRITVAEIDTDTTAAEATPASHRRVRHGKLAQLVGSRRGLAVAGVVGVVLVAGIALTAWKLSSGKPEAPAGPVAQHQPATPRDATTPVASNTPAGERREAAKPTIPPTAEMPPANAPMPLAEPGRKAVQPVRITTEHDVRRVQAAGYAATVEGDGCLTSLKVGGVEFLWPGLGFSRGSYFFQGNAPLKLPLVEQPAPNVLAAKGAEAAIRYEFGPDATTWTLQNTSDQPENFFLVLAPAVKVAMPEQGTIAKTPAKGEWPAVTWVAGGVKLKTTGGTRVWPWFQGAQVVDATLAPHETRTFKLEAGAITDAENQQVAAATGFRHFKGDQYEAEVAADGCLTSLRVAGTELLWVGGTTSRGVYVFQQGIGALKLPTIEQNAGDAVSAKGDLASVRYEFGPDTMTWTVQSASDQEQAFFMVFSPAVKAVANDKGEWSRIPAKQVWPTTSWFVGTSKLTITGGTQLWGPFEGPHQVWHLVLPPKTKRTVTLKVDRASEEELAKVAELSGPRPAVEGDLTVMAPLDHQVVQRRTRTEGTVPLRGKVKVPCDKLEARLTGKSLAGPLPDRWQPVALKADHTFDAPLAVTAGGWYKLEMRALKGDKAVAQATVPHVGVGEVFIIAGQSNSTNCSQEKLQPKSGMVASFSGTEWQPGDDPQPGVHDGTAGGSCWPSFGDAMYAKYQVPIGIASTGHAGTSVGQWQPGGELFQHTLTRIRQLGPHGFRAVLWHQGESDVTMPTDDYVRQMTKVIQASKQEAGWDFPWFVAQVSYHDPYAKTFPLVRAAQKKLWDTGVALEGPDTDTLTGDNRDNGGQGIHFSGKGNRAHGKMWAEKVGPYLDRVLGRPQ